MEQEEILRQEAVRLHLSGLSATVISEQLGRTRQWVYKWLKKYERSDHQSSWFKNQPCIPKTTPKKTDGSIERAVLDIRKRLSGHLYAQTGATSILYELERIGVNPPPSMATINRILKRNDLIKQPRARRLKNTEYPNCFLNVQQMDLIGPRYLKGGFRFYFYTIMDTENHFAGVYPITDKSAQSIAPCLIDYWQGYQMPDYLQMDNELSFRGSNRHPRGLGLLMRVSLSENVTPVFIPPAEPWRNGIIEKFNHNVQKYFYDNQTFASFDELKEKTRKFVSFHNENHRYSSQGNRTPCQIAEKISHKTSLDKEIDLTQRIHIEDGRLVFIRFIKSDLKLHLLNEVFMVKPALKYSYVVAEIVLEKYVLIVSQNNTVYHVFPFAMSLP